MFGARYHCVGLRRAGGRALRAALLASTALVAAGLPAAAQDATWLAAPINGDYIRGFNWSSGTAAPAGTAFFGASAITGLSLYSDDETNRTDVGGWTFNAGAGNYTFANYRQLNFNGAGIVINGGSATITVLDGGSLDFHNASTAGSATILNNAGFSLYFYSALNFYDTSTAGNASITTYGDVNFYNASTAGSAHITINYNGETGGSASFRDSSTAGSASITNTMFLSFLGTSTAGSASITNNNGFLRFYDASTAGNATITNNAHSTVGFFGTSTGGNAAITNAAGGRVDFSASTGPAGDGKLSVGSIAGAGDFFLGARKLTVGGNNLSTEVSGVIADCSVNPYCFAPDATGGSLVKTGTGTLTLSGVNTYTGATTVDGGILRVDGSIASSSLTSVSGVGLLMGTGTVGSTTIGSGGSLLGGNGTAGTSLAISGNLAFQSGATYLVAVDPATASFTSVTGTATLGGAMVKAVFAPGSYVSKKYTILTADGDVSGTFAASPVNTNLPANFHTALSYDATHAYLDLTLNYFSIPGGLNQNQQAVGNALTNYFNSNGSIAMTYAALSAAGLSQASGEIGTGAQQATFNAMGQFMGLLTDPFMARNGSDVTAAGATGFAASAYAATSREDAFATLTKAAPVALQRWSVWAAGFGGSQSTDGNAAVGSNGATSRLFGTAVGADYRFSAHTLAGFALAGGGTNFAVNGLGSGRSDLFQAGAYLRHTNGPFYLSSALAYGWQDISTDRTVTIAGIDRLHAAFNANAWSGRLESGYRLIAPWTGGIGITPYAASQFTVIELPAYVERAIPGTPAFALAYAAKSASDSRSELGFRTDKSFAVQSGVLTLRGRFAWVHDFDPDRTIASTFQALPGASFVVNGARQASDSALATASAEMKWMNGWSAAATFEGEFSNVTRSYAGKGTARYVW